MRTFIKLLKYPLLLATIAIAIGLNPSTLYARGGSKANIPDTQGLHDANRLHGQLTGHKSGHCPDSHKPAKECKTPTIDDISIGEMERYNHGVLEAKKGSSLETFTTALREQITEDRNCGLEEVNLSGLKQRVFVRFRENSGLHELLTLLQEKCPSLTYLSLEGMTLKQEDFKILSKMTSLKQLNLQRTNLTADDFRTYITKLTKLETLLISPSPANKRKYVGSGDNLRVEASELQYPHDFDLLPKLTYFDGLIRGGFGTIVRRAAMGAALFDGHAPFPVKIPSNKKTYQMALRTVGREILDELANDKKRPVNEALAILHRPSDKHRTKNEKTVEPTAKDYSDIGELFSEYPDVAHYFFGKAATVENTDNNDEERKGGNASYQQRYQRSAFEYNRDLYKYSDLKENREWAERQMQSIAQMGEYKRTNPAQQWLDGLAKHEKQAKRRDSVVEFTYHPRVQDQIGIKAIIRGKKQEYFSDYGCTLQQLDLGNVKIPPGERSDFTSFLAQVRRECKDLRTIKLDNVPLTDRDWEELSQMDQVTQLHLQNIPLSSKRLKAIHRLNRLTTLHLQYSQEGNHISKSDLESYVFNMRNLTSLGLRNAFLPGTLTKQDFQYFNFYYKQDADIYLKQAYLRQGGIK